MKRRIATIMLAMPLMAGGVVFAEKPMAGTDARTADTRMDTADQKVMTKRISECIGKDVYNRDGKEIGDIKDVVLDGGINRISYVVVSYGGVMGVGDKLFAVPWKALEHRPVEKDKIFINIPEETLKNAPGFDKDHWPDMADKQFRSQVDRYYDDASAKNAADRTADKMADKADHMADKMNDRTHDATAAPAKTGPVNDGLVWSRRASAIIGADVRNASNENLGDIEDLVINAKSGHVQYAVLSFGGILGIGDKLFAIPASSLQGKANDDKFVLDIPKDRLKAAPGFNKSNWPDFADPAFRSSIDTYYTNRDAAAKTE